MSVTFNTKKDNDPYHVPRPSPSSNISQHAINVWGPLRPSVWQPSARGTSKIDFDAPRCERSPSPAPGDCWGGGGGRWWAATCLRPQGRRIGDRRPQRRPPPHGGGRKTQCHLWPVEPRRRTQRKSGWEGGGVTGRQERVGWREGEGTLGGGGRCRQRKLRSNSMLGQVRTVL